MQRNLLQFVSTKSFKVNNNSYSTRFFTRNVGTAPVANQAPLQPPSQLNNYILGKTGNWEVVIGLEIHCQIDSSSKLFSGGSPDSKSQPSANSRATIVDAAFPGTLPVINRLCVDKAICLGLALNGKINEFSTFDRKHYFYFDLPQGYQITQYYKPIVSGGQLSLETGKRKVRITQIQLEQDSGKSSHDQHPNYSLIDLNRAGSALLEIVTEADMRSSVEASEFVRKLQFLVRHVGVSNANMDLGEMRCDVNISVNKPGQPYGTRTEIKNINSPRYVQKAIEYEAKRHIEILENGGKIIKQTLQYDAEQDKTIVLRTKQEEMDYRFFPDPDLPPLILTKERIEKVQNGMPETPEQIKTKFIENYGLTNYDLNLLMENDAIEYFEKVAKNRNPKKVASWIISSLFAILNASKVDISNSPITAERLGQLIDLVESGKISRIIGKDILEMMINNNQHPLEIATSKGLLQSSDDEELRKLCEQAINLCQKELVKYKNGNTGLFRSFVGQVMKLSQGKANPQKASEMLKEMIDKIN